MYVCVFIYICITEAHTHQRVCAHALRFARNQLSRLLSDAIRYTHERDHYTVLIILMRIQTTTNEDDSLRTSSWHDASDTACTLT